MEGLSSSYDVVVRTGGALGWDTWLAQIAIALGLPVHLYAPFPDQASRWPFESQRMYEKIKSCCSEVFYTHESYQSGSFHQRDIEMITGADEVVTLLDPTLGKGGTFFTVGEAQKLGIPLTHFWS